MHSTSLDYKFLPNKKKRIAHISQPFKSVWKEKFPFQSPSFWPELGEWLRSLILVCCTREIHPLDPQPHRYCMLASTAFAPRVTRCSLGLYWSRDLCSKRAGWLISWMGDVVLSRSDSERQRNLMIHDQCPLPVYFSQVLARTWRVTEIANPCMLTLQNKWNTVCLLYVFSSCKKHLQTTGKITHTHTHTYQNSSSVSPLRVSDRTKLGIKSLQGRSRSKNYGMLKWYQFNPQHIIQLSKYRST